MCGWWCSLLLYFSFAGSSIPRSIPQTWFPDGYRCSRLIEFRLSDGSLFANTSVFVSVQHVAHAVFCHGYCYQFDFVGEIHCHSSLSCSLCAAWAHHVGACSLHGSCPRPRLTARTSTCERTDSPKMRLSVSSSALVFKTPLLEVKAVPSWCRLAPHSHPWCVASTARRFFANNRIPPCNPSYTRYDFNVFFRRECHVSIVFRLLCHWYFDFSGCSPSAIKCDTRIILLSTNGVRHIYLLLLQGPSCAVRTFVCLKTWFTTFEVLNLRWNM